MFKLIEYALIAGLTLCVLAGISDVIHAAQSGFQAASAAFPH